MAEFAIKPLNAVPEPIPFDQPATSIALGPRRSFVEAMAQFNEKTDDARDTATDRVDESPDQQLRTQIEDLVSMSLLLPMLKMARDDPFKSEMFHGGFGEEVFGAQMDMVMAEELGPRLGGPIIEAAYRRLSGPSAPGALNHHG